MTTTQAIVPDQPCQLCGAKQANVLSTRSRSGAFLRTVICKVCGLVWSDPKPHDPRNFYSTDYRLEYKKTFEPKSKHILRAGRIAIERFWQIREHLPRTRIILDVGSGGGEFCYLLKKAGLDITGVEPNVGYANFSRREYGLNVINGFINDINLPRQGFDLITIWHVLEHTENPGAILSQLQTALADDGTLVVEVPNVEAICQSPGNTFHEAHLYSFNLNTLNALAHKAGLVAFSTRISKDGGNLQVHYRKADPLLTKPALVSSLTGNEGQISQRVHRHRIISHLCSRHPYLRFFRRLGQMIDEFLETRLAPKLSGRDRLDRLYAPFMQLIGTEAKPPKALLPLVMGSYLLALLLEWLLLDHFLPMQGWGQYEAFAAYVLLQHLVITAVVTRTQSVPRTLPQYFKHSFWTIPLFLLPIYC